MTTVVIIISCFLLLFQSHTVDKSFKDFKRYSKNFYKMIPLLLYVLGVNMWIRHGIDNNLLGYRVPSTTCYSINSCISIFRNRNSNNERNYAKFFLSWFMVILWCVCDCHRYSINQSSHKSCFKDSIDHWS